MAEFCKDCFIEHLHPTASEICRIVMSEEEDYCEGCGQFKPFVLYIKDLLDTSSMIEAIDWGPACYGSDEYKRCGGKHNCECYAQCKQEYWEGYNPIGT